MTIFKKRQVVETLPTAVQKLAQALSVGKRVLLVDADDSMWEIIRHVPESMLCDVEMVTTAGEAKQLMEGMGEIPFSFIIVDVGILNGDGIALYRWIKENFPTLQTYFLTNAPRETVERKIRDIGSAPVLEKSSKIYSLSFWQDLFSTYFKIGWRKVPSDQTVHPFSDNRQPPIIGEPPSPAFRSIGQSV